MDNFIGRICGMKLGKHYTLNEGFLYFDKFKRGEIRRGISDGSYTLIKVILLDWFDDPERANVAFKNPVWFKLLWNGKNKISLV